MEEISRFIKWFSVNVEWLFSGAGIMLFVWGAGYLKNKYIVGRRVSQARMRSESFQSTRGSVDPDVAKSMRLIREEDPRRVTSMPLRICSLCQKSERSVKKMVIAGKGLVCDECLPELLQTFDEQPDRASYVQHICDLTYEAQDPKTDPSERDKILGRIAGLTMLIGRHGRDIPGSIVVGCRLVRHIGSGSFANVWEATTLKPKKSNGAGYAAVKIFKQENLGVSLMLWRFNRGIRAMQKFSEMGLSAPKSIARLYEVGPDKLSFSMEYFPEGDLQKLARLRLSLKARLEIFREVLEAVSFAHKNGVIHRDIKPANILVRRDRSIALTDFDISDLVYAQTNSYSGAGMGSPQFAAPEQLIGDALSAHPSADVFSLGKLLYFLMTESVPPIGGIEPNAMPAYLNKVELPRARQAIALALQNEPENRPQTVDALAKHSGLWV